MTKIQWAMFYRSSIARAIGIRANWVDLATGAQVGGARDDLPDRKMFVSSLKEQLELFHQIRGPRRFQSTEAQILSMPCTWS